MDEQPVDPIFHFFHAHFDVDTDSNPRPATLTFNQDLATLHFIKILTIAFHHSFRAFTNNSNNVADK